MEHLSKALQREQKKLERQLRAVQETKITIKDWEKLIQAYPPKEKNK